MLNQFKDIYNELKAVKEYLIKIGPSRRQGNIVSKKLSEANALLSRLSILNDTFLSLIKGGTVSQELVENVRLISTDFQLLYATICSLCSGTKDTKMDTFDLKTALALLPVMTDQVENTKQLIDGIEYYEAPLS